MKWYHKKRMLKLAEYLKTVPQAKFDMQFWKCATTACAIGHACEMPFFKRLGLHLEFDSCLDEYIPTYKKGHYFWAISDLFGISVDEAERIFCDDTEDYTAKQMSRFLTKYVKDNS